MSLCECGCGGEAKPGRRFIDGHNSRVEHPLKGKHLSEETKQKIRETQKINREIKEGKRPVPELPFCACGCGGRVTKPGNKYINGHNSRVDNPLKGKHQTEEAKQKLREAHLGTHHSEVTKQLMSEAQLGEKNHRWLGGISFEPYCEKFDDDLKERVRDYFNGCCYVCGIGQSEFGRKLDVHHVNYDKMVCCNDVKPLFVPLCKKCHVKTYGNREYWEEFFTTSLNYLTNGECFLPKKR